ncbi:glycosyltransferase family 39 protein, partial [Myxococcota bacterium]|nr:glycosyltransferase family 39 protein [Myxococcota bacterium]
MDEKRWGRLALIALLGVYGVFALHGASRTAVTVDELGHLPSGLLYLESGDPRFASLNPPLVNVISALPVTGEVPADEIARLKPSDDPFSFWENGYRFMEATRSQYLDLMNSARRGPIIVVALLGVLLFFWAGRLNPQSKELTGLLAAGLVLLSPNVLAQASLVGTDTGTAFFVALSILTFGWFLKRPTWAVALCAGLTLGLAQLTKFYALLLYPSFLILMLFGGRAGAESSSDQIISPWTRWWAWVGMVAVSLFVLNCGYLWAEFSVPLSEVTLESPLMESLSRSVFGQLPLPLPAAYLRAFDGQLVEVGSGMPSVLWGERFQGGRWDYFLGLLAMKTPIAIFLAFGVAVFGALRGHGLPRRESMLLWVYPLLLFLFVSLGDRRQLGARALLSAAPLV